MSLDLLSQAALSGPAFTEPFVRYELEHELAARRLLPRETGAEGRDLQASWEAYRRLLRELVAQGGAVRVRNHVLEPLAGRLGYARFEPADEVTTREGQEPGGTLMLDGDGARLRTWATDFGEDLDAPARRGRAYRFSHSRIAQRVLLATGEQVGLLTNGLELRLLISNPAGRDSQIEIPLIPQWQRSRDVPDTYRLLLALASPAGIRAVPDLVEKARLQQTRVTKELRVQARQAVERFVQEVLDYPDNAVKLAAIADRSALARQLWREGLILVYRLLFILKSEASDDPAQGFSFASTSLWRNTFSPSVALAPYARTVLDAGAETGGLLEGGLRALFRMFEAGLTSTELNVKPLGGFLFGANRAPLLSELRWGERGVAYLLDRLLWTPRRRGSDARERVHYGPLDVKDLGRVYEALLELEPGISSETMCRLRRAKLEVVVPLAQGQRYRSATGAPAADETAAEDDGDDTDDEEAEGAGRGRATAVEWVEEIPPNRFYLRAGLGRKSSGSFYTPDSFVTFLVQETLGPLVERLSPHVDPRPLAILSLKVGDDACGSGHFLVESDRFLGDNLYEACRACDERALEAERRAETLRSDAERQAALAEAAMWRGRVAELPDPNDELLMYLPSRAPEGAESGVSQRKALALCKRLVAVHCLYGVDKNPLAVELARLALWIETQAEGLPLTFLDHRIVVGDSLTGPFFEHLLTLPSSQKPLEGLWSQGLTERFTAALGEALALVRDLEATVGATLAEIAAKQAAKARLDRALAPFRIVAAAWAGGVMLGPARCDDEAYRRLARAVGEDGSLPADLSNEDSLRAMIARGLGVEDVPAARDDLLTLLASGRCVPALPFELVFPEVFFPTGDLAERRGFHAKLGNPPWDAIQFKSKEFFAAFDFDILSAPTERERTAIEKRLLADPQVGPLFEYYKETFEQQKRANDVLYRYQKVQVEGDLAGRQLDYFRVFMERNSQLLAPDGLTGVVVPSAFHANEGATGIRRLYLEQMGLECCYSFENRRQLFEIHRSFKFALVVARRRGPTGTFRCAFYLHDDEWLFGPKSQSECQFSLELVRRTGGDYLTFIEPRSPSDLDVLEQILSAGTDLARLLREWQITPNTSELPMLGADVFIPSARILSGMDPRDSEATASLNLLGYAPLHEGKTFFQFDDMHGDAIRYVVRMDKLVDRPRWWSLCRYYRFAYREVSGSTNERTGIAVVLPPGTVSARTAASDITPSAHTVWRSLWLAAFFNSYCVDFALRSMVQTHLQLFIVKRLTAPDLAESTNRLLAHSAVRLQSNHAGYAPLWREQLGDAWREPTPPFTWPVLASDDARWAVRAAIDAIVAQAYSLDREQYAHVLSTFSHRSYPKAPELCLARFDELAEIGLDAFTRKWDPYWDVPLSEGLPEAVIEVPGVGGQGSGDRDQRVVVKENGTEYRVRQLGLGI